MATVRYTVVGGKVLAEKRAGVRRLYVPDPLGSTLALRDNTQVPTDSFTYWPYGEEATRVGTTPTPFRFVGAAGYYRDSAGLTYVRSRYLRPWLGRWQTTDPLRQPNLTNFYWYCKSNPQRCIDIDGRLAQDAPGLGEGECPGRDAYDMLRLSYLVKPSCAKAFQKVCNRGGGLAGEVGRGVQFIVREDCLAGPNEDSACLMDPRALRRGRCRPTQICFTTRACGKSMDARACLLLIEIVNWCACKYHNDFTERKVKSVLDACGLADFCRAAGVVL